MTGSKKITTLELKARIALVSKADQAYSLTRQCVLLGIIRSTIYYTPQGYVRGTRF